MTKGLALLAWLASAMARPIASGRHWRPKTRSPGPLRGLFAERGYVPTTIAAIAESADIPSPTIYSAFGGKATILQHLAHLVVGELEVDRVHDDAIAHPDPAAGLRMAAGLQRRQFEVMYDVIAIYQEAARVDTEIARAQQVILANRERAFRRHLTAIARHLTPRVTVEQAVESRSRPRPCP